MSRAILQIVLLDSIELPAQRQQMEDVLLAATDPLHQFIFQEVTLTTRTIALGHAMQAISRKEICAGSVTHLHVR